MESGFDDRFAGESLLIEVEVEVELGIGNRGALILNIISLPDNGVLDMKYLIWIRPHLFG